ncbi:unnamed protein product [Gadus morhua 'NCC']
MKIDVVHHDKLKAYHSRTALDNGWVLRESETWTPVEKAPPSSDPSSSETDIRPFDLWGTSPETEDPVVEALPGLFSPPPSPSSSQLPCHPTEPSLEEAWTPCTARGEVAHPLLNPSASTPEDPQSS